MFSSGGLHERSSAPNQTPTGIIGHELITRRRNETNSVRSAAQLINRQVTQFKHKPITPTATAEGQLLIKYDRRILQLQGGNLQDSTNMHSVSLPCSLRSCCLPVAYMSQHHN